MGQISEAGTEGRTGGSGELGPNPSLSRTFSRSAQSLTLTFEDLDTLEIKCSNCTCHLVNYKNLNLKLATNMLP